MQKKKRKLSKKSGLERSKKIKAREKVWGTATAA
jgi:hypothetical protein